MQLISDSLKESLWGQYVHEVLNSHIYLYIAGYLQNKGLNNIAKMFMSQYEEEKSHSLQIFGLLTDLNTPVSIAEIPAGDFVINTPMDIAQQYLEREILTTTSLSEIKDQASEEGNYVVEELIRKMIAQQQNEYAESTDFQDKILLFGNDWKFVALWDVSIG